MHRILLVIGYILACVATFDVVEERHPDSPDKFISSLLWPYFIVGEIARQVEDRKGHYEQGTEEE
jgi:hypothetical protein